MSPADLGLMAAASLTFGSSFLFMAEALESLPPAAVTAARISLGFVTLALVPRARRPVDRAAWPRLALLGILWMAVPLSLYPLAQQHISSAVAGMINGGTPVMTAVIGLAAFGVRANGLRFAGLGLGLVGIVLAGLPSVEEGASSALGVFMVVGAIACYGVSFNVVGPLQARYGALPVLWRVQSVALVATLPLGIASLDGVPELPASTVGALLLLGAGGTALAYVATTALSGRVGATRASIVTYLATPVALVLGVVVRGDEVVAVELVGVACILSGAWIATRAAEPAR